MFKKDGKPFDVNVTQIIDDVQYPAGYFHNAEAREAHGIVEVANQPRPDDRFFWVTDNGDGSFTATPKDRGQVNAMVWEWIKAKRDDRRFNGGVKVGSRWFRTDQQATGEYTALAMLAATLPDSTVLRPAWRTMKDGVVVDMTAGLVKQILAAGFAAVAANDDAAQTHKAALEACNDPSAYDFSGGWPAIYGE